MESSSNQQSKEPQGVVQNAGNRKKGFSEIVSVVVILIILFGILNYFNILPLSSTFPQLGFLPRSKSTQTYIQNTTSLQPTLPPYLKSDLSSTDKTIEAMFFEALPNIIYKQLSPDKSQVNTNLNTISKSLVSSWTVNGIAGTATFSYTSDGSKIADIYLSFSETKDEAPSKETAPKTASAYFPFKPKGIWICKPIYGNIATYCENFWEEDDGTKKGIGIEGLFARESNPTEKPSQAAISFCQRNKESSLYAWKSCSLQFMQEGIK